MSSPIPETFTHPEVEMLIKASGNPWTYTDIAKTTLLSVLELYKNNTSSHLENMDHRAFSDYCSKGMSLETTDPDGPLFRIIFVKSLYLPQNNNGASINDNTALLMHKHLGVPMLFFRDQAPVSTYLTIGNAMFVRRDDAGKQVRLDGYYQFCSERDKRSPTHTWFSYSSEPWSKVSSYVIHQCPANTEKLILQCAKGSNPLILARPFSVDAFLLNDMVMDINFMLIQPRATLLSIESLLLNKFNEEKGKNVRTLHRVARDVGLLRDSTHAMIEALDYLINARKKLTELAPSKIQHQDPDRESALESLLLLKSKANSIIREVLSLAGRASLKIDLEYNLENQRDSHTNLKIASLTTDIAVASQKDSSSMITMAAVTMFFLPGTFVSAFFSMVFFNPQDLGEGKIGKLSVSPQWWLFPAITVPLTVIIFGVWIIWKRRRNTFSKNDVKNLKMEIEPEETKALLGQTP